MLSAMKRLALVLGWALVVFIMASCSSREEKPAYRDAAKSIDTRVEDLLGRMTLEEKLGQMNMPCVYIKAVRSQQSCKSFVLGKLKEHVGPGGGLFTLSNTILRDGPQQQVAFLNELQKLAVENTRLGIPLIQIEEGTHGLMAPGGTVFPEGLGMGSSFDIDLIREVFSVAAAEARSIGVTHLCTLVVEPIRDPRLGRNEEAFGEDTYLCSRVAEAIVNGAQGKDVSAKDKVAAVLCHYPCQSQPTGGTERGSMEVSERNLREIFLPSWQAGFNAGALGVMATYPEHDGVPAHASHKLLTQILRNEFGFKGFVVGEGGGLHTLFDEHVVSTEEQDGEAALKAGLDVGISHEEAYMDAMYKNVQDGRVSVELIDTAVRRVLTVKFMLGLFENPYADLNHALQTVHAPKHQDLALRAAREGIVLLKNDKDTLPLSKEVKSIAVIGPNADNGLNQLGDYSPFQGASQLYRKGVIPDDFSGKFLKGVVTVLQGIRSTVSPATKVTYVKGCGVTGSEEEIQKARAAAAQAGVAVVVLGEDLDTDREGADSATLELQGRQMDLVQEVYATGTPTVVVLINGRPLAIPWIAENVPAIIEAWNCGEKGGQAVAEVLFGGYNPSGHMAISVPRHAGQLPVYYNRRPSRALSNRHARYIEFSSAPLFPFGRGLSYTSFEYSNLHIAPERPTANDSVSVSLDVKNTGSRAGADVVQLYLRDVVSSTVRPVIELKGFERLELEPGQGKTVNFTISSVQLTFVNPELKRVLEPGTFEVMIGKSSQDIALRGSFEVVQ